MTLLLAALFACDPSVPTPDAAPAPGQQPGAVADPAILPPSVARAVELAKGIRADPTHADAVLTAKNATAAELDELMFQIAADPELTAAYATAITR